MASSFCGLRQPVNARQGRQPTSLCVHARSQLCNNAQRLIFSGLSSSHLFSNTCQAEFRHSPCTLTSRLSRRAVLTRAQPGGSGPSKDQTDEYVEVKVRFDTMSNSDLMWLGAMYAIFNFWMLHPRLTFALWGLHQHRSIASK